MSIVAALILVTFSDPAGTANEGLGWPGFWCNSPTFQPGDPAWIEVPSEKIHIVRSDKQRLAQAMLENVSVLELDQAQATDWLRAGDAFRTSSKIVAARAAGYDVGADFAPSIPTAFAVSYSANWQRLSPFMGSLIDARDRPRNFVILVETDDPVRWSTPGCGAAY